MPDSKRTLYLLDAMALAYRAHFIFINRPLINSRGFNTSATYGFTSALVKLIEDHGINHMAVVFDVMEPGGTFRDEMYEDYKGHRDPPPEELIANLPHMKRVVEAMDIPVIEVGGVEADDVIGTLALRVAAENTDAVIVSPDKDFQQLIGPHVTQFRPAYRGEEFDPVTLDSFREKYGLEPVQFIDVLALMGDSADNVPGVHGIGEKTAIKLISEYGTIEKLIEHADELSGKRAREGMQQHADMAILSKKLVTIKTDVPLDLGWDDFKCEAPNLQEIRQLFDELEFSRLYDRVARVIGPKGTSSTAEATLRPVQEASSSQTDSEPDSEGQGSLFADDGLKRYAPNTTSYKMLTTLADVKQAVVDLEGKHPLSFDTETTSTDPMLASLVGISLSTQKNDAVYIPTPLPDGTPTEAVLAVLAPLFTTDEEKIGQNVKYDWLVLARHGAPVNGPFFDTMVAHYLVSPEASHGMDALARNLLGYETIPISSLIGKGKDAKSMRDVAPVDVSPYACEDADITLQLSEVLRPQLGENGVESLAFDLEFPLIEVLARMEVEGIKLDRPVLQELSVRTAEDLEVLQKAIFEAAGEEFNIASPAQIGKILFEKIGLRVVSKTSTGKPSTKESDLQELASEHELPAMILDWRELAKLKSTYIDSLGDLVHPETGRLHTSYSQTVAATGRLSSSNPNLQNIPIRTERGREIRKAFVPKDGCVLLSADYAQIELRILASLADDEAMQQAYLNGEDIHTSTAARVFGVPLSDVTREQRGRAKEVNYGIPYGISAYGLSNRLRCPVGEAQELIDTYNRSFPSVARYLTEQIETARENGYAETMLGRRRYLPDIDARNRNVRAAAERVAVNMPIQGTQADMIKLAMIAIDRRIREENLKSRMLLQVHDELVFEVPHDEVELLKKLVEKEMTEALLLKIPVEVSMGTGANWLEAH
ncbi:MAG: DNA polymerase I [Bacteroidetes bacterium]|nr:DNA polymerase I [Bacteroidota bacterium]